MFTIMNIITFKYINKIDVKKILKVILQLETKIYIFDNI